MVKNTLLENIEYYERLVNDFTELEPEEVLLLQSERDNIQQEIGKIKQGQASTERYLKRLDEVDQKLKAYSVKAFDQLNKEWWWYLDSR